MEAVETTTEVVAEATEVEAVSAVSIYNLKV